MQMVRLRLPWSRRRSQVGLRIMLARGLVEDTANIVHTQVVSDEAMASIRARREVPLYQHHREGHPPSWSRSLLVETGQSVAPLSDSRYVVRDSHSLYKATKGGIVSTGAGLSNQRLGLAALGFSLVAFLAMAVIAQTNYNSQGETVEATSGQTASAETASGGDAGTGVDGGGDGGGGAEAGSGGTSEVPVAPADGAPFDPYVPDGAARDGP